MKNINKYKTPQDKMEAWRKWADSKRGCRMCRINQVDEAKTVAYLRKAAQDPLRVTPPILLCDKATCFNAWLHSTTEEKKGK